MRKKTSWKDKIDPAFDSFIKFLVKALDLKKLPSDLEISNLLEKSKNSNISSFKSFYEDGNKGSNNIFDFSSLSKIKEIGLALKEIEASKTTKDNRRFYKTLISLADDLPDKSKEYYYKAFDPLSSIEKEKEFENSRIKEDQIKWFKEFEADMSALFFHKCFLSLADSDLKKEKKSLENKLGMDLILSLSFDLLNRISLLANKKPLKIIYAEAKEGNQGSLIQLLRIDKTLFDHEWVRKLMIEAMIGGDNDFFARVGQAIESGPPLGKSKRWKMKYILIIFWKAGLYRLTKPELLNLLGDSDLDIHEEPESFYKFIDREIKPLFK